jgi:endogenous inhibitor of DNA gyrase (YacG/DUF329 family)
MFELYVRCPTTGEPVYAGFQSGPRPAAALRISMENSVCPACGRKHVWDAASVCSAIPVMSASGDVGSLDVAEPVPEIQIQEEWPKVA